MYVLHMHNTKTTMQLSVYLILRGVYRVHQASEGLLGLLALMVVPERGENMAILEVRETGEQRYDNLYVHDKSA